MQCLLPDPPTALWHQGALVFSYRDVLSLLRNTAEWEAADMTHIQGGGEGFDARVWEALCEESGVPLGHHRVAAYLCFLPAMPRSYFDIPPCRFCGITSGNQWAHVQYCPVLYLRANRAQIDLIEAVAQWVQVTRLEVVDQLAYLETPGGVLIVGVLTETEAPQVREWVLGVRRPDQVVVVTWTGLIQVTPVSQRRPLPLSRSRCVQLCQVVMARMACDVPRDEGWLQVVRPPPRLAAQASDAGITFRGYSVGSRPRAEVQPHVQQIVAWILHRVTHAVLPWVTDLSVPPRALQEGGYRALQVHYCTADTCHAAEHGPGVRNACVVCPCGRPSATGWALYTMYGTTALYVSNDFTSPELPLY